MLFFQRYNCPNLKSSNAMPLFQVLHFLFSMYYFTWYSHIHMSGLIIMFCSKVWVNIFEKSIYRSPRSHYKLKRHAKRIYINYQQGSYDTAKLETTKHITSICLSLKEILFLCKKISNAVFLVCVWAESHQNITCFRIIKSNYGKFII